MLIAYDQLNTAGGTKVSKLGVKKIIEQVATIREESDLKEIFGERIQIKRENKADIDTIWYEPESYNGSDILPVFVYAHGGAWIGLDAVDEDSYM